MTGHNSRPLTAKTIAQRQKELGNLKLAERKEKKGVIINRGIMERDADDEDSDAAWPRDAHVKPVVRHRRSACLLQRHEVSPSRHHEYGKKSCFSCSGQTSSCLEGRRRSLSFALQSFIPLYHQEAPAAFPVQLPTKYSI